MLTTDWKISDGGLQRSGKDAGTGGHRGVGLCNAMSVLRRKTGCIIGCMERICLADKRWCCVILKDTQALKDTIRAYAM